MSSSESVSVPLLSSLIPDGIKPSTIMLVEYDPESQWFAIATTIAAMCEQIGSGVLYLAMARPREEIRSALKRLGLDVPECEKTNRLWVDDWHSITLGLEQPASNPIARVETEHGWYIKLRSLKVSDLSVAMMKGLKGGDFERDDTMGYNPSQGVRGSLIIAESISTQLRFNEEKPYLEWIETRVNPMEKLGGHIVLQAVARGLHSEMLYKRLENAADGLVEIKVLERDDEPKTCLRIKSLKGQPHDARWHEIEVKSNGEATLTS